MTTIILTIIGILLAASAALMVIFYGGDAFNSGNVGAQANTVINAGTNVVSGVVMYQAHTGKFPDFPGPSHQERLAQFAALEDGAYLKSVPSLPSPISQGLLTAAAYYYATAVPDAVCARININLKNGVVAPGTDGKTKKMMCVPSGTSAPGTFYARY